MAKMNFQPIMTFVALVAMVLVFVYAMKNPNFKSMLTGIFQKLTGKEQQQQQQQLQTAPQQTVAPPPPQQQQQQPSSSSGGPGPITPTNLKQFNACESLKNSPQTYQACLSANSATIAYKARIGIA